MIYVDPTGHYYVEYDWDGTNITSEIIIVEKGDTLSKIAQSYYGDSKVWRQFGYTEKQARSIQPGTRIDVSNVVAIIDLGSGWMAYKHRGDTNTKTKPHIHVGNKKVGNWSQNNDGSVHDDHANSPGEPPGWVKKGLKEKEGWDWDANKKDWGDSNKPKEITPTRPITLNPNYRQRATEAGAATAGAIIAFKLIKAIVGGAIGGPGGAAAGAAF